MIHNTHALSRTFKEDAYCVLDRYFLAVPALMELSRLNDKSTHRLDIITRAKSNCIAYEKPVIDTAPRRGRPRKKGTAIKLCTLFEERANDFVKTSVMMYGTKQEE